MSFLHHHISCFYSTRTKASMVTLFSLGERFLRSFRTELVLKCSILKNVSKIQRVVLHFEKDENQCSCYAGSYGKELEILHLSPVSRKKLKSRCSFHPPLLKVMIRMPNITEREALNTCQPECLRIMWFRFKILLGKMIYRWDPKVWHNFLIQLNVIQYGIELKSKRQRWALSIYI